MKKLINAVEDALTESMSGFGRAHRGLVRVNMAPRFVARATPPVAGKVALISGGGTGHEPMHMGFVGHGMLDAACPGEVFTAPTPDQIVHAAQAVDGGAGVLLIVKNFAGDVMNFEMASELLPQPHVIALSTDDVAIEPQPRSQGRRGVAGTVVMEKLVGAAAERGADLSTCAALADRVNAATGSMGVALTSCTVPATGQRTFELGEFEMEMGVGIHGEPGRHRVRLQSADDIAAEMVRVITQSIGARAGDEVLLLVNGMGATPLMELYLMYEAAARQCQDRGLTIVRSLVGNLCTSLDMAGCSLTVTRFDPTFRDLWDAPVRTPALRWGM